jgi:ADP-ribose pyrophosphatase YjhB (NUDIX family)
MFASWEKEFKNYFKKTMKKYPNVTIKIIFRYKDKILMLRHGNGAFDFPGGRMEWKESILGTLKREIKEELNYFLENEPELFDIWNYVSKNGKRHSVMVYFIYQLDKKPKFSSSKNIQILWLTEENTLPIIEDKKLVEKIFKWKKPKNF